jgi:hypothetical protein
MSGGQMIGGQGFSGTGIGSAVGVGNGLGASRNPPLISISMLFLITFILNLHYFWATSSKALILVSLFSLSVALAMRNTAPSIALMQSNKPSTAEALQSLK